MPLHTRRAGDCRGTETDGNPSERWCSLCYRDGRFVDPDCTLPEMIHLVDQALREDGARSLVRWMAKRQVPKLDRWR